MLLGTLDASLLGNLLTGKVAIATSQWPGKIRAGEDTFRAVESTVRAGQNFKCQLILELILKYKSIIKWTRR